MNYISDVVSEPMTWLTITSVTINVIAGCVWLLEIVQDWRGDCARSRDTAQFRGASAHGGRQSWRRTIALAPLTDLTALDTDVAISTGSAGGSWMYRLVDLLLSQALALYALSTLLWLPVVAQSFRPPTPDVRTFIFPAVCAAIGRHVFFCVRGWRWERSAVPSFTHFVSAICYVLFLRQPTTLILAIISLVTELGSLHTQLLGVIGERCAAKLPNWVHGVGVIFSIMFNGLVYLLILALALARRSPMLLPPLAISLFFFYITYNFIMNTYNIYLVVASFSARLLDARMARLVRDSNPARFDHTKEGGGFPKQAISNIGTVMCAGRDGCCDAEGKLGGGPDDVSCSDNALLVRNIV